MQDTIPRAPAEAQAARARRCALCEKPPGVPCQAKPEADHLARFLDAYVADKLSRAYLAAVVGELVVIDRAVMIPATGQAPALPAPRAADDPVGVLRALGAKVSPDLDAYASGEIDASQVRCLLCGVAPCHCRQCEAPYLRYLATESEPCGMTIGPDGPCPRGHREDGAR